jgi:hypothetical protein
MVLFCGQPFIESLLELLDLNLPPHILAFVFIVAVLIIALSGNEFTFLLLD